MELLKGAGIAKKRTEALKETVAALEEKPCLAFVRVGENGSDLSYEGAAMKRIEKVGATYKSVAFPETVSEEELAAALRALNEDPAVHGILMFRPLPKHLNEKRLKELVSYEKDLDCMSLASLARVFCQEEGFAPCTAEAVIAILKDGGISLSGKHVVVLGRSLVIGKPVSMLFLKENATVTICHSKSENLAEICKTGDILVAAVGRSKMVTGEYVKDGAVLVDVGINVAEDGTLTGDIDPASVEEKAAILTPVPGGVGGMTTCILAEHLLAAYEMQQREKA